MLRHSHMHSRVDIQSAIFLMMCAWDYECVCTIDAWEQPSWWDKIKARPLGQKKAKKQQQQGNKMHVAWKGRGCVEGWKDESGRKTIREGKYLAIHSMERGCGTHLCCGVCVLWNDNVWHTGPTAWEESDSEGREMWREGERRRDGNRAELWGDFIVKCRSLSLRGKLSF